MKKNNFNDEVQEEFRKTLAWSKRWYQKWYYRCELSVFRSFWRFMYRRRIGEKWEVQ